MMIRLKLLIIKKKLVVKRILTARVGTTNGQSTKHGLSLAKVFKRLFVHIPKALSNTINFLPQSPRF